MLETAQVTTTVLKFNSGGSASSGQASSTNPTGSAAAAAAAAAVAAANALSSANLLPWECDSAAKFSPIKLEAQDSFDDIVLNGSTGGGDYAELKPLAYDYASPTSLTGMADPVLSNNNNSKGMTDLNLASPTSTPAPTTTQNFNNGSSSSASSTSSTTSNQQATSSTPTSSTSSASATSSTTSAASSSKASSTSDVTSTGSTSPPGITRLVEDFTASQDAFDDLASIVGISMGADSTVHNIDGDVADLDWIENIKPLSSADISLELPSSHPLSNCHISSAVMTMTTLSNVATLTSRIHSISNPVMSVTQPYLTNNGPSTLQSLLQGSLHPAMPKVTQLQQRDGPPPPPPYSILQNRLTHGAAASLLPNHVIKVDSTYDLMKTSDGYSYASDSLPHSTQSPLNHVTTSDQSLHRRLTELGVGSGGRPIKTSKKMRPKLNLGGGGSPGSAGSNGTTTASGGPGCQNDQNRKMTHHCPICNRSFLNKSNIKVHLRTHTGEKPFKCEHCSKAFRQKAHLLKHMSIHKRISRD